MSAICAPFIVWLFLISGWVDLFGKMAEIRKEETKILVSCIIEKLGLKCKRVLTMIGISLFSDVEELWCGCFQ
jgi:hypothetical protein